MDCHARQLNCPSNLSLFLEEEKMCYIKENKEQKILEYMIEYWYS